MWEPLANLKKSQELIEEWHKTNPQKKKPKELVMSLTKLHPYVTTVLLNLVCTQICQRCMDQDKH